MTSAQMRRNEEPRGYILLLSRIKFQNIDLKHLYRFPLLDLLWIHFLILMCSHLYFIFFSVSNQFTYIDVIYICAWRFFLLLFIVYWRCMPAYHMHIGEHFKNVFRLASSINLHMEDIHALFFVHFMHVDLLEYRADAPFLFQPDGFPTMLFYPARKKTFERVCS
jgi:hypothetical protein